MTAAARSPVVALGLLTFGSGRCEVTVVTLTDVGRRDPMPIIRVYLERGVSVVAALSRVLEPEELAAFVPGVARCPDVAWIAAAQDGASA